MSETMESENQSVDSLSRVFRPELLETIKVLKSFGECSWQTRTQWCDYSSFTLNDQRINDLLGIIEGDVNGEFQEAGDIWVPVHAWRILAANQVAEALPAIVDATIHIDDDWAKEDLPDVIAKFGISAIPSIRKTLLESTIHGSGLWGHVGLLGALGKVAQEHSESKAAVYELLVELLSDFELHLPLLNSFVVSELVDLGDPAALPLIQKVFARRFLDESVLDWPFVRGKFSDVPGLPDEVRFEKYNINEFRYSGDDRFQKLLKSLDSAFNIEELKFYLMGSHLAIDLIQPSAIIEDVLTDLLDQKTEFGSEGQALYFYREFFGLWNQLAGFQTKLFEFPVINVSHVLDFDECELWVIIATRTQWFLMSFLDGLDQGNTNGDRLKNGDAGEFIPWLEEMTDFADRSHAISLIGSTRFHRSEPPNFTERIHFYWI